jgi:uncharacterized protein YndB with AHSA1/START domain
MARTDRAARVVAASPDRVFAALIDPEALAAWLPPAGMTGEFERFDARPGGSYRLKLTYHDPSTATGKATPGADIVEARFVEITPGERVVQTVEFVSDDPAFAGTMTMTWAVRPVRGGTRVDITAADVPAGISPEDHAAGLASSLANLAAHVEPQGPRFLDADLRYARFVSTDLSGSVVRGGNVAGMDIDAPWLADGETFLRVNGVDVIPYVEAELDRRFPGRADRRAADPDGLRTAWAHLERTWAATLERVEALPAGSVDVSVDGEWSFAQTLRHLVLATDAWLGRAVLELDQPFHPLGLAFAGAEDEGLDPSIFTTAAPTYAEVLEVRAGRVAMVRDFLATVTPDELDAPRKNPWAPAYPETTRSCLHVILEEEWEHHRFAVRDLDALEPAPSPPSVH